VFLILKYIKIIYFLFFKNYKISVSKQFNIYIYIYKKFSKIKKKLNSNASLVVACYRGLFDVPGLGPCMHLFQPFGHPSKHSAPEKKRKKKKTRRPEEKNSLFKLVPEAGG
jgi:hypothetical protein